VVRSLEPIATGEKLADTQADLEAIEQEILDEVAEIDERWKDVAAEVDTVSIRLEATDVRVAAIRLVWVATS